MNIILIGCGTVGNAICQGLVNEGHNVTVIDNNEGALSELCNSCDVTGLIGNGIDITVLKSAGAERADLLIAVTNEDEINLLSCHAAKTLGVKHSVARVRDPKFAEYIELMKNDMGLSFTINPERRKNGYLWQRPRRHRGVHRCGGLAPLRCYPVRIARIT